MTVLSTCMCICVLCACLELGGYEKCVGSMELELEVCVSHHMGLGNQIKFARAINALNVCANSLVPIYLDEEFMIRCFQNS